MGEPLELGALRDARKTVPGRRLGEPFDQRVPCAAVRTLSLPLRRLAAAFGAGVDAPRLRHQSVSETGTRAANAHRSSQLTVPSLAATSSAASASPHRVTR